MPISLAEAAEKRWGTPKPVELSEEERQKIEEECEKTEEKLLTPEQRLRPWKAKRKLIDSYPGC